MTSPSASRAVLATDHALFASDGFQQRLASAMVIARMALSQSRKPYIAYSGGKDSLAVTAIVHTVAPDVELLWSDDELEYPETVEHMTRLAHVAGSQLTVTLGWAKHAGWFRPWHEEPSWREPLPGSLRIEQDIDEYQGEQGYDLVFLGLRAAENRRRRDWLLQAGHTYRNGRGVRTKCNPIYDWSSDDVWALIAGWHLPYNRAYDVLADMGRHRNSWRLGPLPLAPRITLEYGWPELLAHLELRYGRRWDR